jgi:hypothetical protein
MHYGKSAPLPSLRRPILCLMHADLLVRRETPPGSAGGYLRHAGDRRIDRIHIGSKVLTIGRFALIRT